jgi:2-polyprenyl-3-methyl-5-hydroxy-6-metoxy-1,4-benzoquinol methylase
MLVADASQNLNGLAYSIADTIMLDTVVRRQVAPANATIRVTPGFSAVHPEIGAIDSSAFIDETGGQWNGAAYEARPGLPPLETLATVGGAPAVQLQTLGRGRIYLDRLQPRLARILQEERLRDAADQGGLQRRALVPATATGGHTVTGRSNVGAARVEDYSHLSEQGQRLVRAFRNRVVELVVASHATRVLEVGCGQGWLLRDIAEVLPDVELTGIDIRAKAIEFARSLVPRADLRVVDAGALPFADGEFGLVVCSEVLEHVDDPVAVLVEIERVGRGRSVISVPDEPRFWIANLVRGKHLRTFGNCPGHIHHWSRGAFVRLLSVGGGEVCVERRIPWLIANVDRTRRG